LASRVSPSQRHQDADLLAVAWARVRVCQRFRLLAVAVKLLSLLPERIGWSYSIHPQTLRMGFPGSPFVSLIIPGFSLGSK
jgi:hypothetical protein